MKIKITLFLLTTFSFHTYYGLTDDQKKVIVDTHKEMLTKFPHDLCAQIKGVHETLTKKGHTDIVNQAKQKHADFKQLKVKDPELQKKIDAMQSCKL